MSQENWVRSAERVALTRMSRSTREATRTSAYWIPAEISFILVWAPRYCIDTAVNELERALDNEGRKVRRGNCRVVECRTERAFVVSKAVADLGALRTDVEDFAQHTRA